jgi:hypothetical protein
MKTKFNDFMNESYKPYEYVDYPNKTYGILNFIDYKFTNKNNNKFKVSFNRYNNSTDESGDFYEREYINDNNNKPKFGLIKDNDPFNILRTVTNITIDFIKEYEPNKIVIHHVSTNDEIKSGLNTTVDTNKRAKINKRFLENSLPDNYNYELKGSFSYITKIN